jgi:hypothetical protein
MGDKLTCLRCGGTLDSLGEKSLQSSDVSFGPVTVGFHAVFAPHFEVEVYVCGRCRHLEFFAPAGETQHS